MGKNKIKEQKAVEAKIAENLSSGAQVAIVLCANAFRFGGNWGYLTPGKEFTGYLEALKGEREHVKAYKVSNGALVLAKENFLAANVNAVLPNAINGSFVEMAKKRRADEKERFEKFLNNVVSGKSKYAKGENGRYALTLGIFSVNDTNRIVLNGEDYPAYKLSLIETLEYLDKLKEKGVLALVHAVKDDGTHIYAEPFKLGGSSAGMQAVHRGLEISETQTGVFLKIAIKAK